MDSGKIHIGFWVDADFGISEGVDFTGISFIKNSEFIKCLKNYLKARAPDRSIAKIEALNYLIAWNTLSTCLMRQWWQEENLGPKFVLSKCH
jgi:hypothetical protein